MGSNVSQSLSQLPHQKRKILKGEGDDRGEVKFILEHAIMEGMESGYQYEDWAGNKMQELVQRVGDEKFKKLVALFQQLQELHEQADGILNDMSWLDEYDVELD